VAAGTAGCATIPFYSSRLGGRPIGRTPDSESGYPGSSPGLPANLLDLKTLKFAAAYVRTTASWPKSPHNSSLSNFPLWKTPGMRI
jgi:hypothetical protein